MIDLICTLSGDSRPHLVSLALILGRLRSGEIIPDKNSQTY